jgi:hypothetical protein
MDRRGFLRYSKSLTASAAISTLIAQDAKAAGRDVYLNRREVTIFSSVQKKLNRIQRVAGYGNFNIISIDEAIKIAKDYSKVGNFTKTELDFMEEIFYEEASKFGFYGRKTCFSLTDKINKKDLKKIPHTGHYLYKGRPIEIYHRLQKDIGDTLVLTSGVRSVVKQMTLFFNKIKRCGGNISLASHSLAPPGYSYHSIGDFDVGKRGWGYKNFTVNFARTREFWEIMKLDYVSVRYSLNNKDGVRFEPWHVKIV